MISLKLLILVVQNPCVDTSIKAQQKEKKTFRTSSNERPWEEMINKKWVEKQWWHINQLFRQDDWMTFFFLTSVRIPAKLTESTWVYWSGWCVTPVTFNQVALGEVSSKGWATLQLSGALVPAQSRYRAALRHGGGSTVLVQGSVVPHPLPQSQAKPTCFRFLLPVSSCQNHTSSNDDVHGMELNSARNSIPLFSVCRTLTNTSLRRSCTTWTKY